MVVFIASQNKGELFHKEIYHILCKVNGRKLGEGMLRTRVSSMTERLSKANGKRLSDLTDE